MTQHILQRLFEESQAPLGAGATAAINDLAAVTERHTLNKYGDAAYDTRLAHQPELQQLRLENSDLMAVKHFFFYLLLNYPDRAAAAARGLVKCYDPSITEGVCQAIELYWQKDDEATSCLTDAITHAQSYEQFGDRVMTLFKKLHQEGLPVTRKNMSAKFAYYRKYYGFTA